MEDVLQIINKNFIALDPDAVRRNNQILDQVLQPLGEKIEGKSPLFKQLFMKKFYGGSYYDGIKISKPEEYDLDYVMKLPKLIEPEIEISDKDGFVLVHITEFLKLFKQKKQLEKFEGIENLLTSDQYLSTTKVLQWMEQAFTLALNLYSKCSKGYHFPVKLDNREIIVYGILYKAHPAFTLKLRNEDENILLDIDLVPCFQFTVEQWPRGDYRRNTDFKSFLVVPKKPYGQQHIPSVEKYWRLSFQEQERGLLTGVDFKNMKPALKLIKKLRDHYKHNIASYFIKTVFLWQAESTNKEEWAQPLCEVFLKMLKVYSQMIMDKRIPYYWNENFNLIGHLKETTLCGIANFLENLIKKVEAKKNEDPFIIATYLLQADEVEKLRTQVNLSRKNKTNVNSPESRSIDAVDSSDYSRSLLGISRDSVLECNYSLFSPANTSLSSGPSVSLGGPMCDISLTPFSVRNGAEPTANTDYNELIKMLKKLDSKIDGVAENLKLIDRKIDRLEATLTDTISTVKMITFAVSLRD